jgi:heat shock protein HslJ
MRRIIGVAMLLLLTGCDEASPTAPSQGDLAGVVWQLQSLQRANAPPPIVPGGRFTLQFTPDGRLAVRADCNTCNGSYQLDGARLQVGALACTRAFCGTESLDVEFLRVFEAPAEIVLQNQQLLISRAGTRLTFAP